MSPRGVRMMGQSRFVTFFESRRLKGFRSALMHAFRTGTVGRLSVAIASMALAIGVAGVSHAAEVRLVATENCVEVGAIIDEVEGVIGRPLATVMGARFDVEITRVGPRRWRLQLRTMDTAAAGDTEARATRELEGATCDEVASAAAVAIAVSIQTAGSKEKPTVGETSPKRSSPPAPSQPGPAPAPPVVDARQAVRSAPSAKCPAHVRSRRRALAREDRDGTCGPHVRQPTRFLQAVPSLATIREVCIFPSRRRWL